MTLKSWKKLDLEGAVESSMALQKLEVKFYPHFLIALIRSISNGRSSNGSSGSNGSSSSSSSSSAAGARFASRIVTVGVDARSSQSMVHVDE